MQQQKKAEKKLKFWPLRGQKANFLADSRSKNAKKYANDYGVSHWTTSMEESISHKDVDVVCIALPNNLHEDAVPLCCKHNKAVVCTKPLGRNATEAKRMVESVEKAGIFAGYLEDLCYTPKFLKALEKYEKLYILRFPYVGRRICEEIEGCMQPNVSFQN